MRPEAVIVGAVIRRLRKEHGLSQEDVAFESGVDRSFLSNIERGLQQPSISVLFRIAEVLETPAWSILAEAVENDIEGKSDGPDRVGSESPELPQELVDTLEREVRSFITAGDPEAAIAYIKLKILEAHLLGIKEGLTRKEKESADAPADQVRRPF